MHVDVTDVGTLVICTVFVSVGYFIKINEASDASYYTKNIVFS